MRAALFLAALVAAATAQAAGVADTSVATKRPNSKHVPTVWRRKLDDAEEEGESIIEKLYPGCGEEDDCDEHMIKWSIVVGVLALAGTFIIGFLMESAHIEWMPEAGVGVLMGFIVATAVKNLGTPPAGSLLLPATLRPRVLHGVAAAAHHLRRRLQPGRRHFLRPHRASGALRLRLHRLVRLHRRGDHLRRRPGRPLLPALAARGALLRCAHLGD